MNIQHIISKRMTAKALLLGALLGVSSMAFAQGRVVKGRIVDTDGQPVVGAVVNIAEQSRIVLTDENGEFSITKVGREDELCASCVGYKNIQVKPTFDGNFKIVMEDEVGKYEKTMPVPFGRKKKKLMTEATSVVTGEELQKHPVTVLQNAFTATVNGMETYEWSSEPGWTETAMYIRGIRTMNSSARAPLVIVDNVERDLSFLDAFPIENITIIKDAAAASIYGMRGANGVIMVTTKRGEAGKTKIDFTQEVGFQTLMNTMETQNSYNQALTRNQVRYLSGMSALYTDDQIEMYRRVCAGEKLTGVDQYKYFNTNWFDVLYRDAAPTYRTNLQLSGGNDRARYYVSFSYLRQEGMWNSEGTSWNEDYNTQHCLNRYNLRTNIDIDVNKYLNVTLDIGGRIDNINQPTTSVFNLTTFGAVEADPMQPVYCPDGSLYSSSTAVNPLYYLSASGQEKNKRRNLYTTLNVTGDLGDILKGLKAKLTVSFDAYETFESTQTNNTNTYNYDYDNASVTDVSEFTYTRYTTYSALSDPTVNQRTYTSNLNFIFGLQYQRNFGKHGIDAYAFMRTYRNELAGSDYSDEQEGSSNRFFSWNGTVTYDYDNRYILTGNISRMGCDNFSPDNRWDTFWGVSGAWVASDEKFLKSNNIDLLKVRLSYGKAGQSTTGSGRYPYQSSYASGTGYGFGYSGSNWVDGYYESVAGSSNNIWEVSEMLNVGLDFDFFHGKLYGNVDVFKEWRSQILVDRSTIPSILGVTMAQDSYGKAETKGFEIVLGHKNQLGDFGYHIEAQLTYNTNKITEMDETEPNEEWLRMTGNRIYDYTSVASLYESSFDNTVGGWNIYQFVCWASDENLISTSQEDAIAHPEKYPYSTFSSGGQDLGTAVFKDLNGDRQIDSNDMYPATYTIIPELIPTVNIGFTWKGFDARAVFTAYLKRSVFLSPAISYSGWSNMGTHEVTKAWGYYTDDPTDPRNINAKYPRPVYNGFNAVDSDRDTGSYMNDIWIVNGNFLTLKNVEIGYSLPAKLIAKASLTKCRIYFSGYNLCTWSSLPDGVDPEKPMSYCWWYPKTRNFTFGINIGF